MNAEESARLEEIRAMVRAALPTINGLTTTTVEQGRMLLNLSDLIAGLVERVAELTITAENAIARSVAECKALTIAVEAAGVIVDRSDFEAEREAFRKRAGNGYRPDVWDEKADWLNAAMRGV